MRTSAFSKGFRSKIISEGLAGYFNTLRRRIAEGQPLNRTKEEIRRQSRSKRNSKLNNWFNSGSSTYDTVVFVPATPLSSLANLLQKHETQNNQGRTSRIKIVERAGRSLKTILAPNCPWGVQKCTDAKCFPCSTSTGPLKVSCRTPGVVYSIVCVFCEEAGLEAIYFGESGHNCYTRGRKHLDDFHAGITSNCMSIHARVHHPDEPRLATNFKMIPLKTINKPMDRQITEALNIANANVDILLNSGSEWRSGLVPRASVSRPS